MWSPFWSILVCKMSQFFAKSYRLEQLIILFQKLDTLRLLKIYIMFCPPTGLKYTFFMLQLMDLQFNNDTFSKMFSAMEALNNFLPYVEGIFCRIGSFFSLQGSNYSDRESVSGMPECQIPEIQIKGHSLTAVSFLP